MTSADTAATGSWTLIVSQAGQPKAIAEGFDVVSASATTRGVVLHDLGRRDDTQQQLDDSVARLPIRVELDTTGGGSAVAEETE